MKPFINTYKFGSFEIRMMEKNEAGGVISLYGDER